MTTKRTDKESIFTAALEIENQDQRRAFLDAACGPDAILRAEIESLLRHDEMADGFIEGSAVVIPPTIYLHPDTPRSTSTVTEGPGTVIDHYKLLERIGEGGFGVVFMAEQSQPIRRKVALKILKPGMDTHEV